MTATSGRQREAQACFRRPPVAMQTSSAQTCDVASACDLGANSHLVRPIDFPQFTELAEHLERYGCQLNRVSG